MIEYRTETCRLRFESHRGSFASKFGKLLIYCVIRSTQPSNFSGLRNGLRGENLVWLNGVIVCLLTANCESKCLLAPAIDGRIVRCRIISSCKLADSLHEIVGA